MNGLLPTRRTVLKSLASAVTATSILQPNHVFAMFNPAEQEGWNKQWDNAALMGTMLHLDHDFDLKEDLVSGHVGPEYSYQSNLRNQKVHPTRTSMEYALYLLEVGGKARIERATTILNRLETLQDRDPQSKWFGLWSWYLEEPLDRMPAVDPNWADFNGSLLISMILRHQRELPATTLQQIRRMLRHCCAAIRIRNVSMDYTNIACMGTFVTLAGSEILDDADLHTYAVDRLRRFAGNIDKTGSFAEYNSPTYNKVVVQNMTRIMTFVKDSQSLELSNGIHERIWLHIATHWHLPTRQIAAPMSRCYNNDLGAPLWLQKALNNALIFMDIQKVSTTANEDVGLLNYHCPDDIRPYFTSFGSARLRREVFILGAPTDASRATEVVDVEGTTYLAPSFCLGSANRSDFWNQRRPLMAYWTPPQHPVRCLQMKVLKDDYDFSSALFYSVQSDGAVLGQVGFRSDGGDRHISLDPIRNQTFTLSRMVVQLSFDVWDNQWRLYSGGQDVTFHSGGLSLISPILIDAGPIQLAVRFLAPQFGSYEPHLRFTKGPKTAALELTLMSSPRPITLNWSDVHSAGCGIALFMTNGDTKRLAETANLEGERLTVEKQELFSNTRWASPKGLLTLTAATAVRPGDFMDQQFRSSIDGKPVPMTRLSDVLLLGRSHLR